MKRENSIIMKSYLLQFCFFTFMISATFEIQDYSENFNWPAMTAGGITFFAGLFTLYKLRAMKKRLSYDKTVTDGLEDHWDDGEEKMQCSKKQQEPFLKNVFKNITFEKLGKKSVNELGTGLLANDSLPKADVIASDDSSGDNENGQKRAMLLGPLSYEGEMKKRGRRTGNIMGNRGRWLSRYFVLLGNVLYEFYDKKAFEAVLKENNGMLDLKKNKNLKSIPLSGYEILVDAVNTENPCLILSPLDEDAELLSRYYRVDTATFREWARHLVSASLTSQGDDKAGDESFLLL
jgi:hypothetical protein